MVHPIALGPFETASSKDHMSSRELVEPARTAGKENFDPALENSAREMVWMRNETNFHQN